MQEWKKIGKKGEDLEKNWKNELKKKSDKTRKEFEKYYIDSNLGDLDRLILEKKKEFFESKPILVAIFFVVKASL